MKYGSWFTVCCLDQVEVVCRSGRFDWLTIDLEHTTISAEEAKAMMRVIQAHGIRAWIRLSGVHEAEIKRVLDAGADGLIAPMVKTADEVKALVTAAYYHPRGRRGAGLARAQEFSPEGFARYSKGQQEATGIIVQIETREAVENVDDIFSVPGIMGYLIGPYDLSSSYGHPGDFTCQEMRIAMSRVMQVAKAKGIRPGIHVIEPDPAKVRQAVDEGYELVVVSFDMLFFRRGMELAFAELSR